MLPVALVLEQPDHDGSAFASEFTGSRYFAPVRSPGMRQAVDALRAGEVEAILRLRADFSERLRRKGGAPVQVIVNGIDANNARSRCNERAMARGSRVCCSC
jgi:ABC-2 type transport system permease protein